MRVVQITQHVALPPNEPFAPLPCLAYVFLLLPSRTVLLLFIISITLQLYISYLKPHFLTVCKPNLDHLKPLFLKPYSQAVSPLFLCLFSTFSLFLFSTFS
jgi:hypothetical protein